MTNFYYLCKQEIVATFKIGSLILTRSLENKFGLSGSNLVNRISHTKLVGQYSIATLVKPINNLIILSGDTTNSDNN